MLKVLSSLFLLLLFCGCSCSNQENAHRQYYAVTDKGGVIDTFEIKNFYMNATTYHLVKMDGTSTFINIDSAYVMEVSNDTTYY